MTLVPWPFLKFLLPGIDHLLWGCRADWYLLGPVGARALCCLCVSGTVRYGVWTG